MYCPKCGTINDDTAMLCTLCDYKLKPGWGKKSKNVYARPTYEQPKTYDIPSYYTECILVTFLCSPLFGIIGWYYASTCKSKLASGDIEGARWASDNARKCIWAAVIINIIGFVLIMANGGFPA